MSLHPTSDGRERALHQVDKDTHPHLIPRQHWHGNQHATSPGGPECDVFLLNSHPWHLSGAVSVITFWQLTLQISFSSITNIALKCFEVRFLDDKFTFLRKLLWLISPSALHLWITLSCLPTSCSLATHSWLYRELLHMVSMVRKIIRTLKWQCELERREGSGGRPDKHRCTYLVISAPGGGQHHQSVGWAPPKVLLQRRFNRPPILCCYRLIISRTRGACGRLWAWTEDWD